MAWEAYSVTFIPIVISLVSATWFPYAINETSYSPPVVLAGMRPNMVHSAFTLGKVPQSVFSPRVSPVLTACIAFPLTSVSVILAKAVCVIANRNIIDKVILYVIIFLRNIVHFMRAFNFKDTYKRFIHKRCFAPSRMSDTSREIQTPQRLFELRLHAPASRNSTESPSKS